MDFRLRYRCEDTVGRTRVLSQISPHKDLPNQGDSRLPQVHLSQPQKQSTATAWPIWQNLTVTQAKRTSRGSPMNGTNMDVFEIKPIFITSMSVKNNDETSSASSSYVIQLTANTLKQKLIIMSFLLLQKWPNVVRKSHEILLIRYLISTRFLIYVYSFGNR